MKYNFANQLNKTFPGAAPAGNQNVKHLPSVPPSPRPAPSSPRPSALWQKCLHRILNTPERTRKKEWYCGEHKYYKGKRTNEDDCKGNAHLPRDLKLVQVQKAANFSFFQRTSRILPWQEKKQSPESSPPGKKGKCKLLKTLRNRRRAAICRMLRKRHYLIDAFS